MLEVISRRISHKGPSGFGTMTKIVNNLTTAVHAAALAEGLVLAERAGLDMDAVLPVLINGANGSPLVKGKVARIVARDYDDTHFALRWMRKDASYGLQAAEHNIAMPTLSAASDVYSATRSLGLDDADFVAVIEAIRK